MGRPGRILTFLFAVAVFMAAAAPAGGQTVQGQILEITTGGPVEGALAVLLDQDGTQAAGYLSNNAGRFLLRAPGPGRYTVRVERIGFETVESDPFDLAPSQIFGIRLQTRETAIELEGIQVESEQQCVIRPGEGLQVSQVWDEARKALTVQEWTDQEEAYRFTLANYERTLHPTTSRVLEETRQVQEGVARSPIRSLPAEELLTHGFIREAEDRTFTYYAPDASVLLSDAFLDTHCFRLRTNDNHPGQVGLAFQPAHPHETSDIEGTLWLSAESSELDYLEFWYTRPPWPEAIGVAGGRVEFEQMPNGAWIIRRWRIHMPLMVQERTGLRQQRSTIRVQNILEVGGEVVRTARMNREVISEVEAGLLTGQVWDSTRFVPLVGAEVYLSGTPHLAVTDSLGNFAMDGIPEGLFTVSFHHPRLDTLPFVPHGQDVEVTPGGVQDVRLAIPSMTSILQGACPEGPARKEYDHSGVIAGTVRAADSERPLPGAAVTLRWSRFVKPGGGILGEEERSMEMTAGPGGRFTACGLPVNHLIVFQAVHLGNQGDTLHARAREGALTTVELKVGGQGR